MKKLFQKIKAWFKKIYKKVSPGDSAVRGAAIGMVSLSILFFLYEVIVSSYRWNDPRLLLFGAVLLLAATLIGFIAPWLINQLASIPKPFLIGLNFAIPIMMIVRFNDNRAVFFLILMFALLGAGISMFTQKTFGKTTIVRKVIGVLGLLVGIAGMVAFLYALIIHGFDMLEPVNAAKLTEDKVQKIDLPSPGDKGSYEVEYFTYGSGKDIRRPEYGDEVDYESRSVDGTAFLDNWEGWSGELRTKYWDFDYRELPLNARVWAPKGDGPFPLVLIVHGNHGMQDYSDPGYDYLGEFLASKGMILASVDENFINSSWTDLFTDGLDEENDARAWLLLEHVRLWDDWAKDESHALSGKADLDRVSLIGHSRGGEAVGHAAMMNSLDLYPDDGQTPLGYNFNIKSVVAIAPVDGQYRPGNSPNQVENMSYLTLHGGMDADVTSFSGLKQFQRIKFTDSLYHFKTGIFIKGANHGQFNTSWGDNDYSAAFDGILNKEQLMSKEDQEQVARVYIGAFLEATLNDRMEYLPFFIDNRAGRDWLPDNIYMNQFEDSNTEILVHYDEDLDLKTVSTGGSAHGENLTVWKEAEVSFKYGRLGTRAAVLAWNYGNMDGADSLWEDGNVPVLPDSVRSSYSIGWDSIPVKIDSTSVLVFSLSESKTNTNPRNSGKWAKEDNNEDENNSNEEELEEEESSEEEEMVNEEEDENDDEANEEDSEGDGEVEEEDEEEKPDDPLNLSLILKDSSGQQIEFLLSDFSHLQRRIKTRVTKMQFLDEESNSEAIYQSYSFPFEDLKDRNADFDFSSLVEIEFVFDQTKQGAVILDQLGIRSPLD